MMYNYKVVNKSIMYNNNNIIEHIRSYMFCNWNLQHCFISVFEIIIKIKYICNIYDWNLRNFNFIRIQILLEFMFD